MNTIIKTATVADLRNHFRRVSAWIENGEPVDIVRRGKAFARLVPTVEPTVARFNPGKHLERIKKTWGDRIFSASEVKAMREAEHEDGEG